MKRNIDQDLEIWPKQKVSIKKLAHLEIPDDETEIVRRKKLILLVKKLLTLIFPIQTEKNGKYIRLLEKLRKKRKNLIFSEIMMLLTHTNMCVGLRKRKILNQKCNKKFLIKLLVEQVMHIDNYHPNIANHQKETFKPNKNFDCVV